MRGFECDIGHYMLISKIYFPIMHHGRWEKHGTDQENEELLANPKYVSTAAH